jgi:hypothetical protein
MCYTGHSRWIAYILPDAVFPSRQNLRDDVLKDNLLDFHACGLRDRV